jgi:hypothetical protein
MDREAEDYHLEGISLLTASLAPGVEHVAEEWVLPKPVFTIW